MKTQIKKFIIFITFIVVIFSLNNMTSNNMCAQTYFSDNVVVPIFEGTIIPNVTTKLDYWDLGEVNTQKNRLDLVAGVSQKGYNGGSGNYIIGNWYKNQYNDNFNPEDENTRFISLSNYSNPINGLTFAKLHSDSIKKDVIITRDNGDLEVYWNSYGTITFQRGFKANGKVAAVGNFTSGDNLEDVAVIMNDTVKIYKNLGNGYLDSIPVYRLANVHASALLIAQISNYIEPYATVYNTTSDKDEIILRQGDSIRIYQNNNSNGTSLSTIIYTGADYSTRKDFKISDLNNDGYNDLVIVEEDYGINVYKNSGGTMNTSPSYRNVNEGLFHTYSVAVGDFDKNGWNDIVVSLSDRLNLYLNNKSDSLFNHTSSENFLYEYPVRASCVPLKTEVADVYNKGGLAVLFSNFGDVADLTENDPLNEIEQLARINASDTDAVPAPAYLFHSTEVVRGKYRPKLLLFNRGDRDFLKYKIYKNSTYTNYTWTLIDSTTGSTYTDTIEVLDTTSSPGTVPAPNLFYYVKAEDKSYKVSVNSDTISYLDIICPTCPLGPDNFTVVNEPEKDPIEFSISNYPNPFNPVTNLEFSIPDNGFVSLKVFDILGKEVKTLVNEIKSPGRYKVMFDGSSLPSGIYYYRIEAAGYIQTKKMLLLK